MQTRDLIVQVVTQAEPQGFHTLPPEHEGVSGTTGSTGLGVGLTTGGLGVGVGTGVGAGVGSGLVMGVGVGLGVGTGTGAGVGAAFPSLNYKLKAN